MLDERWVDRGVTPPRALPQAPDAMAEYLADALGHPVYTCWTWTALIRAFVALPDARQAKPAVCRMLIDLPEVVEAWQKGRLQLFAPHEAPSIERVVIAILRAHRKRFELDTQIDSPTASQVRSRMDVVLPATLVPTVLGRGRFVNLDPTTNTLGLTDDQHAVASFLRDKAARSRHTWRAYAAELSRLATWCQGAGRGPLSDLTRQDLQAYRQWLAMPIVELKTEEDGGSTQAEALGDRTRERALAVMCSLYRYWHETGYLMVNPASGLTSGQRSRRSFAAKRFAPAMLLDACDQWVQLHAGTPDTPDVRTLRRSAIWSLFRCSGVRLAELGWNADRNLPRLDVDLHGGWTLHVLGKGDKERSIPLPRAATDVLTKYRLARGLSPQPSPSERVGLFHGEKGGALGPRGLYDEVKQVLSAVADALEHVEPERAALLRTVSPHWLRHAYARALVVDHKVPLPAAQQLLGHASVQTTAEYAKTDLRQLREVVDQVWREKSGS